MSAHPPHPQQALAHAIDRKAVIDLVADSPVGLGPAVLISLLVTTGLVSSILRRRQLWLVLSWVLFAGLFLVAAAVSTTPTFKTSGAVSTIDAISKV